MAEFIRRYGIDRQWEPALIAARWRDDDPAVSAQVRPLKLIGLSGCLHAQRLVRAPVVVERDPVAECVIRRLTEQCAHRHRFETQQHAIRVYNSVLALTRTPWLGSQPNI